MAASILFLLLLPLAAAAPYPTITKEARSVIKESAKVYMEHKVQSQQGITDLSVQRKDGQHIGSSGDLVLDLSVGTSPQTLSLIMDITSELVWAQCNPCSSCIRLTPSATPTFLPNESDSFHAVGCASQTCQRMIRGDHRCTQDGDHCAYTEVFSGAGNTSGFLATDTFSFGKTPVPGVVFGCSGDITVTDIAHTSGFAGFSRGTLSLVSQLNISSFTYFIAPPNDAAGKSFVSWTTSGSGGAAEEKTTMTGGSTPLLEATENQNPDLYYVNLTGVQVGSQIMTSIPSGTGGVFLSTILPVTYLVEHAYNFLRQELVGGIQSQGVDPVSGAVDLNPLCFLTRDFSSAKVPSVGLMFDGTNATMWLKVENFFLAISGGQLTCLTILPSTGGSVLGSLLQAGRTMTYDIHAGQLTFQTAAAGTLAPGAWLMTMVTLLAWVLGWQGLF